MKTSTIVSAVLGFALLFVAVGCAKTTDLGKMQEETIATVKVYLGELDVLQRRYDQVAGTKSSSSDATAANAMLEKAHHAIDSARTTAGGAPTLVAAAAKSGNAEALTQKHYEIVDALEKQIEIAKDNLAGYETYASTVAYAAKAPPPPPVADDKKPPTDPVTTPPGHTSDIPCSAEILLKCPEGQIDACMKSPSAATHACVAQ